MYSLTQHTRTLGTGAGDSLGPGDSLGQGEEI